MKRLRLILAEEGLVRSSARLSPGDIGGAKSSEIREWNGWLDKNRSSLGIPREFSFYKISERYLMLGDATAQSKKYWKKSDPEGRWGSVAKIPEWRSARDSERSRWVKGAIGHITSKVIVEVNLKGLLGKVRALVKKLGLKRGRKNALRVKSSIYSADSSSVSVAVELADPWDGLNGPDHWYSKIRRIELDLGAVRRFVPDAVGVEVTQPFGADTPLHFVVSRG